MANPIGLDEVRPQQLVAVTGEVAMADIPAKMMTKMDAVWAFVRAQGITGTGHNVWLYRPRPDGRMDVEVGVQASRNELIVSLLARCPAPTGIGRARMMDRRGDGVPVILERNHLAKLDCEYRLEHCFLTISLDEPFDGSCHKLIAAVIECG